MKRSRKFVYNPWVCHHPVNTPFISMNDAYVVRPDGIPMSFQFTILALEQPSPSGFVARTAPRANATRASFVYELDRDSMVFGGILESFSQIFVAPKVVYHYVGLFTHRTVIPDACKVSNNNLVYSLVNTLLDKMANEFVYSVSMPSGTDSVELAQSLRRIPIIDFFENALMFGNLLVPVPPITEHSIPTVGYRGFYTLDDGSNRASNTNIYISFVLPTWLTNGVSLYGLMSNPILAVVDKFEFSLFTAPSGSTFDSTFEFEWESNFSPFDFITITPNNVDKFQFASIPILPVSWRFYLVDMGWEIAFGFELEQCNESLPSIGVLSDDLLCCGTTDPPLEFVIEVFPLPVNLTIEKGLPAPIIEFVPEGGTAYCSVSYNIKMFECDLESVTTFHSNVDMGFNLYNGIVQIRGLID